MSSRHPYRGVPVPDVTAWSAEGDVTLGVIQARQRAELAAQESRS